MILWPTIQCLSICNAIRGLLFCLLYVMAHKSRYIVASKALEPWGMPTDLTVQCLPAVLVTVSSIPQGEKFLQDYYLPYTPQIDSSWVSMIANTQHKYIHTPMTLSMPSLSCFFRIGKNILNPHLLTNLRCSLSVFSCYTLHSLSIPLNAVLSFYSTCSGRLKQRISIYIILGVPRTCLTLITAWVLRCFPWCFMKNRRSVRAGL